MVAKKMDESGHMPEYRAWAIATHEGFARAEREVEKRPYFSTQ